MEEIRQDPRFTYMDKFQQFVTETQNMISLKIFELELTWSKIYPKGSQSLDITAKHSMRSKNQFYSQIDQIQKEFLDSVSETPENEFEHYLNKSKFLAKPHVIRKFTTAQETQIKNFRTKATKEKLQSFQKLLTMYQELKVFDDYRLAIEYNLVDVEDKGWYNTVRMYTMEWLPYLYTLETFHSKNSRQFLAKKIRKEIEKIEAWVKKIEDKYDKSIKLDMKQANLMSQSIKTMISTYKVDRQQLKRYEVDRQIIKYLKKNFK